MIWARHWRLLALLPAALACGAATDRDSGAQMPAPLETVVEPKAAEAPAPEAKPKGAELPELDVAALRRAGAPAEPRNLFESKSWYVPPPPPPPAPIAAPAPPPPPTAPKLPFTYLGQYQEAATPVILLMQGERMLVVREGEIIDGIYRVEGIRGKTLTLTYLPLGIAQTLEVEGAG